MANDDLNRSLDIYLDERKKGERKLFRRKPKKQPESEEYEAKAPWWKSLFAKKEPQPAAEGVEIVDEPAPVETEEPEYMGESMEEPTEEQPKRGIFSFLSSLFASKPQHEEEIEDTIPEEDVEKYYESDVDENIKQGRYVKLVLYKPQVKSDIKRVLAITDDLLAKLPKDEKIKFMESPEFELYKSVFQKYNIKGDKS